jgi:hypothetical protein
MTYNQAFELAKKLPGITLKEHFGSDGFSANKRLFLTIWNDKNQANIRLSLEHQAEFLSMDGDAFTEIDNAWGRQGWTTIHLKYIDKDIYERALKAAWEHSAQKIARPKQKIAKPGIARGTAASKKKKRQNV